MTLASAVRLPSIFNHQIYKHTHPKSLGARSCFQTHFWTVGTVRVLRGSKVEGSRVSQVPVTASGPPHQSDSSCVFDGCGCCQVSAPAAYMWPWWRSPSSTIWPPRWHIYSSRSAALCTPANRCNNTKHVTPGFTRPGREIMIQHSESAVRLQDKATCRHPRQQNTHPTTAQCVKKLNNHSKQTGNAHTATSNETATSKYEAGKMQHTDNGNIWEITPLFLIASTHLSRCLADRSTAVHRVIASPTARQQRHFNRK